MFLVAKPAPGGRLYRCWFGNWSRNRHPKKHNLQGWSIWSAAASVAFAFGGYVTDDRGRRVTRPYRT